MNRVNQKKDRIIKLVERKNRRIPKAKKSPTNLYLVDDAIPKEVRIGYWTIAVFLTLLILWGATVPLASGAIAPGVVSVEGNTKIVQHLKGGRVKEILVKEGDLIAQGQTLLRLETTLDQNKYNALKTQYVLLQTRESRLRAESIGLTTLSFSKELMLQENNPEVVEAMNSQRRVFDSNKDLLHEKEVTYKHRISQASTLISSNLSRLSSSKERINSVNSELSSYQRLLAQGLVTRSQTFSLQSTKSQAQDQMNSLQGSINSSRGLIAQYKAEISEFKMMQKNNATKELDRLQDQITSVQRDLSSIKNILYQADIKAPISGYVVSLEANTIGGVIAAGKNIMGIVPNNKQLIIEAHVDPKDRNSIEVGQSAEVRFSAFNRRSTLPINGKVLIVSADRVVDEVTNRPYYNVKIKLSEDPTVKLNGATIHPGMQTEVIISTGKRTASDYFISPLTQSFNRALREN